jgi:hypothetical protein
MEYGSHGDYSYDSDDTDRGEVEGPQAKEDADAARARQTHRSPADQHELDLLTNRQKHRSPADQHELDLLTNRHGHCSPTDQHELDLLINRQKHRSPTDQNEFDLLMRDSLDEEEFFHQLHPSKQVAPPPPVIPCLECPPRSPRPQQHRRQKVANINHRYFDDGQDKSEWKKKGGCDQDAIKDMGDFIFDPFNLMSNRDANPFRIKDEEDTNGDIVYIREDDTVKESLFFVCPLPVREEEEDEDEDVDKISEITNQRKDDSNDVCSSSIRTNGSSAFESAENGDEDSLYDENPGSKKKKNMKGQQHPQGGSGETDYDPFSFTLSNSDEGPSFAKVPLEEVALTPNNTKNENDRHDGGGRGIASYCLDSHQNRIKNRGEDVRAIETRSNQDPTPEAFRDYNFLYDNASGSSGSQNNKSMMKRRNIVKVKLRDLVRSLRVGSKSRGSLGSRSLSSEETSELEEEEVRRLLMIASTFTRLNTASMEKELQEHDVRDEYYNDSLSSHSSSSYYSDKSGKEMEESFDDDEDEEDEKIVSRLMMAVRSTSKDSDEFDSIDCFPAEVDDLHSIRFNMEGEEFEYSSEESASGGRYGGTPIRRKPNFLPCMDAFFDSVCKSTDNAISAMEVFFWVPDETSVRTGFD